ncbi:MAG TPA: long-chain fatty acid--CoA ligase, partial [Proteobacteria bacterium]|nr:long-chain fatty acid--CoA ligase [Pseudomonadota bacterium]
MRKAEYVEKEGYRWFEVPETRPWFSEEAGWPKEVPKNMPFPTITLGEMLKQTADKYPDNKAIWFLDTFITYKQLYGMASSLATALHRLGMKKGDVLALLLPNSIQYVVAYYAAQLIGVIVTGVNPTYKPREAEHQLKITGAKAVIALDSLYEQILDPIIGNTNIEHVIATNIVDLTNIGGLKRFLGKVLKKIPTGRVPSDALKLTKLLETPADVPDNDVKTDDVAAYLMTGGTTGIPKAAVLTHMNLVANALQSRAWIYKIQPGACAIGVLPLFHSFAMTCVMNIAIAVGAWMMLFPRPPKTEELCKTIQELVPQGMGMYPGAEILFKRLAEFPDIDKYDIAGKLALCVSGAGPLHRPVQEAFEKVTGARLVEGYGLTEASPVVSAGPFWGKRKIGTIGLPFPGTDWK